MPITEFDHKNVLKIYGINNCVYSAWLAIHAVRCFKQNFTEKCTEYNYQQYSTTFTAAYKHKH